MTQLYVWLILGGLLLGAEMASGAFFLMFFGIGALLTALLPFLGFQDLGVQIGFFAIVSTALLLIFRKTALRNFQKTGSSKEGDDVGQELSIDSDLPANGDGTITYQGAPWSARNLTEIPLTKGSRVRIEKIEGVKLFVRKA